MKIKQIENIKREIDKRDKGYFTFLEILLAGIVILFLLLFIVNNADASTYYYTDFSEYDTGTMTDYTGEETRPEGIFHIWNSDDEGTANWEIKEDGTKTGGKFLEQQDQQTYGAYIHTAITTGTFYVAFKGNSGIFDIYEENHTPYSSSYIKISGQTDLIAKIIWEEDEYTGYQIKNGFTGEYGETQALSGWGGKLTNLKKFQFYGEYQDIDTFYIGTTEPINWSEPEHPVDESYNYTDDVEETDIEEFDSIINKIKVRSVEWTGNEADVILKMEGVNNASYDTLLVKTDLENYSTSSNLLDNPSFEDWTSGTSTDPDNWTLAEGGTTATIEREDTETKEGSYSAKLENETDEWLFLHQNLQGMTQDWQGKWLSVQSWIYSTIENKVRLYTKEDYTTGTNYESDYNTGTGWEKLNLDLKIEENEINYIRIMNPESTEFTGTTIYTDDVIAVIDNIQEINLDTGTATKIWIDDFLTFENLEEGEITFYFKFLNDGTAEEQDWQELTIEIEEGEDWLEPVDYQDWEEQQVDWEGRPVADEGQKLWWDGIGYEDKWGIVQQIVDWWKSLKTKFPISWIWGIQEIWAEKKVYYETAEEADSLNISITMPEGTSNTALAGEEFEIMNIDDVEETFNVDFTLFRNILIWATWLMCGMTVFKAGTSLMRDLGN